jgi:hypothetical protein
MAMIDSEACYAVWAPDGVRWTAWAKPVVFAQGPLSADRPIAVPSLDTPGLPGSFGGPAIVVDLPGAEAVTVGLALAGRGFRPVPLFNGTIGPQAVIDVEPIRDALGAGAAILQHSVLAPDAPPAFLLDANRGDPRLTGAESGYYDNRWIVLPQDLPSAIFLASHGVREVTVLQRAGVAPVVISRTCYAAGRKAG